MFPEKGPPHKLWGKRGINSRGGPRNWRRGGGVHDFPFPSPLLFLSQALSLPFPLEAVPFKPARGPGSAVSSPVGPKMNLAHFKAVSKTLVAIILNILSTMLYSKMIKI